eukprot:6492521-Amphidinium_carterae.2
MPSTDKWVDCNRVPVLAVHCVECVQKVASKIPSDGTLRALAEALFDGVQLVQAQEKLDVTKSADSVEQDDLVEKLLLVHRRAKKLGAALERIPGKAVVLQSLDETCKKSKSVVVELKAEIAAKMFSQCQLAHKALCDVAGGKKGGLDWCEGFEGKTFEELELAKHAEDSLMKIDGGKMQELQVALDEDGYKPWGGSLPLTLRKCIARVCLPWSEECLCTQKGPKITMYMCLFFKAVGFMDKTGYTLHIPLPFIQLQGCFELTHNQTWEDELQSVLKDALVERASCVAPFGLGQSAKSLDHEVVRLSIQHTRTDTGIKNKVASDNINDKSTNSKMEVCFECVGTSSKYLMNLLLASSWALPWGPQNCKRCKRLCMPRN